MTGATVPQRIRPAIAARVALSALAWVLSAGLWATGDPVLAQPKAAQPHKEYPHEYHPALKGNPEVIQGLVLYGPDAPACVKFEPEGLRITLPPDYPRQRPGTGVVTDFGVKGDFDIAVSFAILHEPKPGAGGNPTDLRVVVVPNDGVQAEMWHKSSQNRASLAREFAGRNGIGQFVADATTWNNEGITKDPWGNEVFSKIELHAKQRVPAGAAMGRLRLVRSGSVLFFYVSEGSSQEFTLLHKHEFGTKDLKNVRILGSTGWLGTSFDVHVTDLWIRADAFPKAIPATFAPAADGTVAPERRWWIILVAFSASLVGLALFLGVWLYVRGRRPAGPAMQSLSASETPAIVFDCPGCGKRLKVKTEPARSKVKCPHCAKTIDVPTAQTGEPEELPCQ